VRQRDGVLLREVSLTLVAESQGKAFLPDGKGACDRAAAFADEIDALRESLLKSIEVRCPAFESPRLVSREGTVCGILSQGRWRNCRSCCSDRRIAS
jgi:hypothetical protein